MMMSAQTLLEMRGKRQESNLYRIDRQISDIIFL